MSIVHDQHQMSRHDAAAQGQGAAGGECHVEALAADYTQDWPLLRAGMTSSKVSTGRGFGRGPLCGSRSGCSRYLAINHSAQHPFHNAVEPFKRHFRVSVRYASTRSGIGGRKIGISHQTRAS